MPKLPKIAEKLKGKTGRRRFARMNADRKNLPLRHRDTEKTQRLNHKGHEGTQREIARIATIAKIAESEEQNQKLTADEHG